MGHVTKATHPNPHLASFCFHNTKTPLSGFISARPSSPKLCWVLLLIVSSPGFITTKPDSMYKNWGSKTNLSQVKASEASQEEYRLGRWQDMTTTPTHPGFVKCLSGVWALEYRDFDEDSKYAKLLNPKSLRYSWSQTKLHHTILCHQKLQNPQNPHLKKRISPLHWSRLPALPSYLTFGPVTCTGQQLGPSKWSCNVSQSPPLPRSIGSPGQQRPRRKKSWAFIVTERPSEDAFLKPLELLPRGALLSDKGSPCRGPKTPFLCHWLLASELGAQSSNRWILSNHKKRSYSKTSSVYSGFAHQKTPNKTEPNQPKQKNCPFMPLQPEKAPYPNSFSQTALGRAQGRHCPCGAFWAWLRRKCSLAPPDGFRMLNDQRPPPSNHVRRSRANH